MLQIIKRENHQIKLIESNLSKKANTIEIKNALLGAIYLEFRGATTNPKYAKATNLEKLILVNAFANKWLEDRGLQ